MRSINIKNLLNHNFIMKKNMFSLSQKISLLEQGNFIINAKKIYAEFYVNKRKNNFYLAKQTINIDKKVKKIILIGLSEWGAHRGSFIATYEHGEGENTFLFFDTRWKPSHREIKADMFMEFDSACKTLLTAKTQDGIVRYLYFYEIYLSKDLGNLKSITFSENKFLHIFSISVVEEKQ